MPSHPAAVQVTPPVVEPVPGSAAQRVWSGVALLLAVPATAAAFLTEDPLYLRVALLAVCWAFVIAAFLAGSRRADRMAATAREAELRHAYDLELAHEVAARHEHAAELENRLRREAEQAMSGELGRLRTELAALTQLRSEPSGLEQLRTELAGLGELRGDLGRMRSELTEQLSGELLIERMVMRAQSVRGPARTADVGRTVEGAPPGWEASVWTSSPAGPDAPAEPGRVLPVSVAEALDLPAPPISRASAPPEESADRHRPPSPLEWLVEEAVLEPWVEPSPKSPLAWLGEKALLDAAGRPAAEVPVVPMPSRPPLPEPVLRVPEPVLHEPEPVLRVPEPVLHEPEPALPVPEPDPEPAPRVPEPALRVSDLVAAMSDPLEPPRRRHRRAAEPDEAGGVTPSNGRRRSHAAPEEESAASPSWSDWAAASAGSGSGASGGETPSWASPAEPIPTGAAPSVESPPWEPTPWSAAPVTPVAAEPAPRATAPAQGHARLEQILAESGVSAPSGGRSRRRRYREEGEEAGDDVLARVLGRN
ncbi:MULTISPECIES: DUF6779 domain-containing protein [unclassified Modestobacter]|uniref:DUF6779 domain-containing protein n=1 Tax=unclassified Modestobacter TaxID=2643866 RepID=UPI0022AAB99B|nr:MULTISPECIES: DUF6779 domain-containing protein [unclassified Modestobacter]MCZ2825338.1 hypothetical protein [Modestobacter sp. VKM Ac-2981]MCZ2853597.1 hypothetical protein [Modestobacter sp. VKM Ac-2982]